MGCPCPKCKAEMAPLPDSRFPQCADNGECDGCGMRFLAKDANQLGILNCLPCNQSLCKACQPSAPGGQGI